MQWRRRCAARLLIPPRTTPHGAKARRFAPSTALCACLRSVPRHWLRRAPRTRSCRRATPVSWQAGSPSPASPFSPVSAIAQSGRRPSRRPTLSATSSPAKQSVRTVLRLEVRGAMVDLRSILPTLSVAEHLSFRRAGAALGLRRVGREPTGPGLEDEIGVSLFERHAGGVRPTTAGLQFRLGPTLDPLPTLAGSVFRQGKPSQISLP